MRSADQRGALLVQRPPVAAHPPHGQEALEALARRSARTRPSRSARPPRPRRPRLAAALAQDALEQEGAAHVVGVALDLHRLALGRRAVHAASASSSARGATSSSPSAPSSARWHDEVGVAADGRGEVAVARAAQAGVADVARRVGGLLERAQHERGQRRPPAPRGAHVRGARARLASAASSAACCGLMCSGTGGVGTPSEASRSTSALDRAAGRGARARGRAWARGGRPGSPPPARWPGSSAARSARATRSGPRGATPVTWPSASKSNAGSGESTSSDAALGAPLAQRRAPPRGRAPAARPTARARCSRAGEDRVDLAVGQPRVAADRASGGSLAERDLGAAQLSSTVTASAVLARARGCTRGSRAPRAASARPRRARRRSCPPDRLASRAARPAARRRSRRRCGPTRRTAPSPSRRAETASSKSFAVTGSMVKVGSAVQVAPRPAPGGAPAAVRRPPPRRAREDAAQAAVEHQPLEHVAHARRAGRGERTPARRACRTDQHDLARADAPRPCERVPPAALEQRLGDQEAARARARRPWLGEPARSRSAPRERRRRGAARAALIELGGELAQGHRERLVAAGAGLSRALVPGRSLGARCSLRSAGSTGPRSGRARRRWRAARPPGRRPCRRSSRPTSFARLRSRSAPATISEALARATVHQHHHREVLVERVALGGEVWRPRLRPSVETMSPVSTKMLETSTASRSRPPPLPRRSTTIPCAPCASSLSIAARSSPCAPELKVRSSTTPSFLPSTVSSFDSTVGTSIRSRSTVTVRRF